MEGHLGDGIAAKSAGGRLSWWFKGRKRCVLVTQSENVLSDTICYMVLRPATN